MDLWTHQQAEHMAGSSRSNLRIGHEPLCAGTTTTTGAGAAEVPSFRYGFRLRSAGFGEVDRVSLRQFYGWSANRRAKLCVSTFPCVQRRIVMSPLVAVQCVTKSYGQQPSKLSIVCRSRLVWANWSG